VRQSVNFAPRLAALPYCWPSRCFRLPFQLPRNPTRGRIIAFQAGKQFWLDGAHHVGANSKCPTALGRLHRLRHEDGANSSRATRSPNRLYLPMPIEAPPRTFDPRTAEPASEKPADVLEAFVVNQVAASHQNASAGRFRCGAGIGTMPLIAEKFAGPKILSGPGVVLGIYGAAFGGAVPCLPAPPQEPPRAAPAVRFVGCPRHGRSVSEENSFIEVLNEYILTHL
jgi:hypothetical protein